MFCLCFVAVHEFNNARVDANVGRADGMSEGGAV